MRRINLTHGKGNGIDSACLLTATSMLIGKPEELDNCSCVCPVIGAFVIKTNDAMPEQLLGDLYGPLIWEIPGTHTEDTGVIVQRAYQCVDWAVRTVLPLMCDAVGRPEQAETLRQLAPVIGPNAAARAADAALDTADAVRAVRAAFTADDAANAARVAALDAARAARASNGADAAFDAALAAVSASEVRAVNAYDIWRLCPGLIRELAAIGDRQPVEQVLSREQLACALSAGAGR